MRSTLFASLLLLALVVAPAEAGPRHHCNPPGARSVARDERGRVYYIERNGDEDYYYACLYRTGRTLPLGNNPHSIAETEIAAVDIAMPYVAFTEVEYSSQATGTFLNRLNVRSGRTIEVGTRGEVKRFVATSFGAVVWAQYRGSLDTTEIQKLDADGSALLDEGKRVNAKSLHVSRDGHRAYWRNDGRPKSARLR
jgi:hypothetical protein